MYISRLGHSSKLNQNCIYRKKRKDFRCTERKKENNGNSGMAACIFMRIVEKEKKKISTIFFHRGCKTITGAAEIINVLSILAQQAQIFVCVVSSHLNSSTLWKFFFTCFKPITRLHRK